MAFSCLCLTTYAGSLTGIKVVQAGATEVPKPDKIKDDWAANWVHDQLAAALQDTGFQVGDSPIQAKVILDEFTSGSFAKRFVIGMGAGRSSITASLVIEDKASGKQLTAVRIHVRGGLIFSSYEDGNSQRREAENSFRQKLVEEIERMK